MAWPLTAPCQLSAGGSKVLESHVAPRLSRWPVGHELGEMDNHAGGKACGDNLQVRQDGTPGQNTPSIGPCRAKVRPHPTDVHRGKPRSWDGGNELGELKRCARTRPHDSSDHVPGATNPDAEDHQERESTITYDDRYERRRQRADRGCKRGRQQLDERRCGERRRRVDLALVIELRHVSPKRVASRARRRSRCPCRRRRRRRGS
jgi:hypothetical protein